MNIIMESSRQKDKNVKIILEKNIDSFGINKIYVQKFLMKLWENPKLIFTILKNAELKELKEKLAPFIVDNFYNNYLSGNYLENNLLYVFALMIKEEVDKLRDMEQVLTFLDDSRCGYLLQQLIKKIDVQIYFKKMIMGTVSKIDNCTSGKINFNINEINKRISWLKSEKTTNNYDANLLKNAKESYKHNSNTTSFLIDINVNYLEKMIQNDKIKNNKGMIDYIEKLIEEIKIYKNPDYYSNSCLLQNLKNLKSPTEILAIYKDHITEIISFINKLIEDLTSNTFLIPHSVKYICKIISILIKKKFKNIRAVDINAFISKFFLGKLLIPIISSPTHNAYITDFVISENTLKNIKSTNIVLSKLFSGCLFNNNMRDGNFTPFNKYFIEKMPDILFFFEKATEVKLPSFIEDLLENKLEENFEYDYFEQNRESIYSNVSIVYKISDLESLVKALQNCQGIFENKTKDKNEKMDKFKLIYNKFKGGEIIQNIKVVEEKIINKYSSKIQSELELEKKKEKDKKKEKSCPIEIECYFLFMEEIYENKYKFIFKLENNESNYIIDLHSLKKNKLNNVEKTIINVKNYLCSTLGNYRLLDISDFTQAKINNTISILEEIKNYITLPNFIINNNTIPSEWYINSLLDNLPLLENTYKENDFLKLYRELYENLNKGMEELNFYFLIILKNIENCEKDISINENIKKMTENIFLPVEVQFRYDGDDDDIFKIKLSNIKEKNFENNFIQDTKKDINIFKTIESFASNFPNLIEYQILQDENPLEVMSKLKIPKALREYFQLIREKLIKSTKISEADFDTLYQAKIEDYFMNKIYDKIYPIEPEENDSEIYSKAIMLSWVEPNLIINKDYIYETSLPDIMHQFQNVNSARTPQKKFSYIQKILELINNLIMFNEGDKKDISLDDVTPVLFYIFIKAHPFKIYTDLNFIKLFLDSKKGVYSFNIKQIESAASMVMACDEKNFGLTKEEFNKRCNFMASNKNK